LFLFPNNGKEFLRVCLFRKKTRLCDDDAFKEDEDEEEEDTSSAIIFLDGRLFG